MKKWIKEYKLRLLKELKNGRSIGHLVLDLIAEIESLDEENKRLDEVVDDWMSRHMICSRRCEELERKIKGEVG